MVQQGKRIRGHRSKKHHDLKLKLETIVSGKRLNRWQSNISINYHSRRVGTHQPRSNHDVQLCHKPMIRVLLLATRINEKEAAVVLDKLQHANTGSNHDLRFCHNSMVCVLVVLGRRDRGCWPAMSNLESLDQ